MTQHDDRMTTQQMFVIKGLDPHAHIDLSTWTHQWYVSANLNIGDGAILTGITEHRATPHEAVGAFHARLVAHGLGEYVTNGREGDERRNWEWNGGAFVEVSTDMLRAKYAVKEMT